MAEETVTEQPANAEVTQAEDTANPASQTESEAAADPVEAQRREQERIEKAKEKAAFAELRRQKNEVRAELERERAERQALTQRLLQGQQTTPQAEGAPDPAKFAGGEFNPDYIRELTRYETRQLLQAERESMTKRQREEESRRNADTARQGWTKSVSDAQGKYSDYELIVEAGAADISNPVKQLLVGLKDGAELLYHLAKEPEKAQALTGNPVEIAAALGELRAEARFAAKAAAAKAAAEAVEREPINPGNGGGRSGGEPDPRNTDAWMRWRAKQG